jgi:CHAT domain-containing protein
MPIEIQITIAAENRLAVVIDYGGLRSAVIGRWHADRDAIEAISDDLDELAGEALREPIRDAEAAEARRETEERLRSLGLALYQEIFREEGDRLKHLELGSDGEGCLVFKIDRSLAQLPLEVMYDGDDFLSHRFAIGRIIYTDETVPPPTIERTVPLPVVIVGDPSGDPVIRADIEQEIDAVKHVFSGSREFAMRIAYGSEVDLKYMLSHLPGAGVFHFTGHGVVSGEEDSTGIQLDGDRILSGRSLAGLQKPPAVAFFNMCTAVSKDAWRGSLGLVETLLRRGTASCIASLWDLRSRSASLVAASFYRHLLDDATFGQALRKARLEAVAECGLHDLTWAAYTLYGDPQRRLLPGAPRMKRRAGLRRGLATLVGIIILLVAILYPIKTHREDFPVQNIADMGYLLLESIPGDARVFIDGEEIGVTPFAAEVPVGSHRISIEKAGYKKWEAWVVVKQKPRNDIQAVLERVE